MQHLTKSTQLITTPILYKTNINTQLDKIHTISKSIRVRSHLAQVEQSIPITYFFMTPGHTMHLVVLFSSWLGVYAGVNPSGAASVYFSGSAEELEEVHTDQLTNICVILI